MTHQHGEDSPMPVLCPIVADVRPENYISRVGGESFEERLIRIYGPNQKFETEN